MTTGDSLATNLTYHKQHTLTKSTANVMDDDDDDLLMMPLTLSMKMRMTANTNRPKK